MGKQIRISGVTVQVEVDPPWLLTGMDTKEERRKWLNSANTLIDEIKRHCDSYTDVGYEIEQEAVCSSCGDPWENGSGPHNGGCCAQDVAALYKWTCPLCDCEDSFVAPGWPCDACGCSSQAFHPHAGLIRLRRDLYLGGLDEATD